MLRLSRSLRRGGDDIATITGRYEVLHREQDPILFTGVNRFGAQILGTFVDEDSGQRARRFLHVQVEKSDFRKFVAGDVTYLDIVKRAGNVYIVDERSGNGKPSTFVAENFSNVPREYLPSENSKAPPLAIQAGAEYVHAFDGGRATLNGADPRKVALLLNSFPPVLIEPAYDVASGYTIRTDVVGFPAGSFEVLFALRHEIAADQLPLFSAMTDYNVYVSRFVDFCINRFEKEAGPIADRQFQDAPCFMELLEARRVAQSRRGFHAHLGDPSSFAQQVVRGLQCVEEIATLVDDDLTSITLFNVADGARAVMGILDHRASSALEQALDTLAIFTGQETVDKSPQEYTITMHSLNKESRVGGARVLTRTSRGRGRKTRIRISHDIDLEPFTESFHLGTFLSVNAIATKDADGRVTYLKIQSTAR
jgi:hypothetical protein